MGFLNTKPVAAAPTAAAERPSRKSRLLAVLAAFAVLAGLGPAPARALLFKSTGDPAYNTSAPTGALNESGWQFQGQWGNYLGTPIGPHFFITAKHVGGTVGDLFVLDGLSYVTTASYDDASSDLRIWQVEGEFRTYASLYTNTTEHGQSAVIFGRGTQRGEEVRVSGVLKGWKWGAGDLVQRWGENTASAIGSFLKFTFDATGGTNEAHLSGGDSGGAVFLNDGGTWKLAGINLAVDGPYNLTSTDGLGFNAALTDQGGLYRGQDGAWTYIADQVSDLPGSGYATRISSRLAWIQSVIIKPEPSIVTGVPGGVSIVEPTPPPAPAPLPEPTLQTNPPTRRPTPNAFRSRRVRVWSAPAQQAKPAETQPAARR